MYIVCCLCRSWASLAGRNTHKIEKSLHDSYQSTQPSTYSGAGLAGGTAYVPSAVFNLRRQHAFLSLRSSIDVNQFQTAVWAKAGQNKQSTMYIRRLCLCYMRATWRTLSKHTILHDNLQHQCFTCNFFKQSDIIRAHCVLAALLHLSVWKVASSVRTQILVLYPLCPSL